MASKRKKRIKQQANEQSIAQTTNKAKGARQKQADKGRSFFSGGFWAAHWMQLGVLMLLAFGLYAASLSFGYVLDDTIVIAENVYVNPNDTQYTLGGDSIAVKMNMKDPNAAVPSLGARLKRIFSEDTFMGYFQKDQKYLEGGRYRPLSLATFAVEWQLMGGLNPWLSHFLNILFYGLTAWLLYRILLGFFPLKEGQHTWFSIAFLGAALFLLHPLHTEAVANIKGRDEILALLGSLGALWAAMKYNDTENPLWVFLSGFILFLGMMAKENAITFVAVIPFSLWIFAKTPLRKNAMLTGGLVLGALAFIMVRQNALGFFMNPGKEITDLMNNPFYGMKGGERLATIFLTLGWYIKLLFVPHPLTHDYYPYHVPKVGWNDWRALFSLAMYTAMTIFALLNLRKRKVLAWAIIVFLATLSIISNIVVSVGTFMNERFLYMPSVAFAVLTAWFLVKPVSRWIGERAQTFNYISGALFLVLVVGYAARTVTRIPDWKDRMSLNTSALKVSPESARSNCFMATALYEDVYQKTNDVEEKNRLLAEMSVLLDKAIEINPTYGSAYTMRAGVAGETFLLDNQMDKLFHEFEPIIKVYPSMDYIQQFMVYLGKRANNDKFSSFCHRMGYTCFFKERKDYVNATRYLEYGITASDNIQSSLGDARLLNDMVEVFEAQGNTAKAAEYRARAVRAGG